MRGETPSPCCQHTGPPTVSRDVFSERDWWKVAVAVATWKLSVVRDEGNWSALQPTAVGLKAVRHLQGQPSLFADYPNCPEASSLVQQDPNRGNSSGFQHSPIQQDTPYGVKVLQVGRDGSKGSSIRAGTEHYASCFM
ncbi:hypothetical protein AOLI_G00106710 [Acnodon oligacanthus]